MTGYDVRPDEETVPLLGAEVHIADPAGLLTAAQDGPVELLAGTDFPAPVREVRCTVRADTVDGRPAHRFEAYLRVEAAPAGLLALGLAGPVGLLLAERLAASAVDGPAAAVGRAAAEATRRL
ncbi:ATP-binding protein, partial [Micromonospora sp. RP3T]